MGTSDKLIWSNISENYNLSDSLIPARCHSAVYVANHVIYFGGGATHTSAVSILSLPKEGENISGQIESGYELYRPDYCPGLEVRKPHARVDGKAITIGRYMVVFGGFSVRRRELGDFWVSYFPIVSIDMLYHLLSFSFQLQGFGSCTRLVCL